MSAIKFTNAGEILVQNDFHISYLEEYSKYVICQFDITIVHLNTR